MLSLNNLFFKEKTVCFVWEGVTQSSWFCYYVPHHLVHPLGPILPKGAKNIKYCGTGSRSLREVFLFLNSEQISNVEENEKWDR